MAVLILAFLIISPAVILYTAGYRLNFKNWTMEATGVISIDVEPKTAGLFLNDIKINKKMPLRLTNRAPGAYNIKLTAHGYHDWQKDISVESNQTAYLKNISLFKQSLPIPAAAGLAGAITDLRASPDGAYLFLTVQNNGLQEINLLNTNNAVRQPILRLKSGATPEISWSPYANFALLQRWEGGKYAAELFNPLLPENSQTYSFPGKIDNYQWPPNTAVPLVYVQQNNRILALDNNEQRVLGTTAKDDVWYVDGQTLWLYSPADKQLRSDDKTTYFLSDAESLKNIIDINPKRIIAQSEWNTYVFALAEGKIARVQVLPTQQIFFNSKIKEWQTWSWWELWSIYENGEVSLLTRTSDKIVHLWPLDKYGLLALASENKITGFNPGYYISHELLNNVAIKQLVVNAKSKKIFFLGKVGQREGLFELAY